MCRKCGGTVLGYLYHADAMGSYLEISINGSIFFLAKMTGINMIFDLPFTFLMRNVSGRAITGPD